MVWGFEQIDMYRSKYQEISITSTEPTNEPITLAEAKNYLKIDYSTDDTLINQLIFSARKQIENELGGLPIVKRSFIQSQTGGIETIQLLRSNVNSITSITFYESFDSSGTILNSSQYRLANNNIYNYNGFFELGRLANGYVIVFDAGLVDDTTNGASNCPNAIKTAILRYIAYLYENREEFVNSINEGGWTINYETNSIKNEIKMLLMPYHTGLGVI